MSRLSFACVKTCTSKPKMGGCFNSALCCANDTRASGQVGSPAWSVRWKIYCVSKGERSGGVALLLVATNIPASKNALHLYRKRWGIECLFADAKTRGFNIEDTHITDPAKLATLLAVVALAMTWAYRCASQAMGRKSIRKKAHKRRAKSWFRIGFDVLRRWILYDQQKALEAWRRTCPKRSLSSQKLGCVMP
ncbi:transposase [Tateyamaria sp.]|uniref:transposase n=1 Tax=Tateyamaria sp. TaxID=1929288 RepID=UPI003B2135AB